MEVNDELGALEQGLRVLTARLEAGSADRGDHFSFAGRSDREKFLSRSQPRISRSAGMAGTAPEPGSRSRLITSKPVEPGENEQRVNPRSRSAKLRVAEKI